MEFVVQSYWKNVCCHATCDLGLGKNNAQLAQGKPYCNTFYLSVRCNRTIELLLATYT